MKGNSFSRRWRLRDERMIAWRLPLPQRSAGEAPAPHNSYFASTGSTITNLPIEPLSVNLMRPVILAKRVSSLPRPTFSPGFTRVPRCRTMIVPPGTTCPPNALKPSRCEFESRPFREVPCPFLCAISNPFSVASCQLNRCCRDQRNLFLLRRFLRSLLRSRLLLRFFRYWLATMLLDSCLSLLGLGRFLRELGSLEALPTECDFGDAYRGESLPMTLQLLVLLFALVVKDQHFCAAAFFYDLADYARVRALADLALFAGHRQHRKLHLAIAASPELLYSNHIAGRHPVLLPTGADNRVHTSASVKCRLKSARK